MDGLYFDSSARRLATVAFSRRIVVGFLTSGGLALSFGGVGITSARKRKKGNKKKKQKRKPPILNAFGCVGVGLPCRGKDALCCSGICQGAAEARQT